MAPSKTADVFKLLQEMKTVDAKTVKAHTAAQLERISAEVEPPAELIHDWEPGYVDEYKYTTYSGKAITKRELWDAYISGENIRLVGPSGCGKSALAFHILDKANKSVREKNKKILAENVQRKLKDGEKAKLEDYLSLPYPVVHYNCSEGTREAHLIGDVTIIFNDKGERKPVVVPGCFTKAWTKGASLIFEEDDLAPPSVLGAVHPFIDGRTKTTDVFLNGPTTLNKNDRFRIIATSNTLGTGEGSVEFAGTQIQNTAYLNRFTYVVKSTWLPPAHEIDLIVNKTGVSKNLVEKMVSACENIRKEYEEQRIQNVITTRDLLSWARETKREEKRVGTKPFDTAWREIAIPAMFPTFLNRISDPASREVIERYLSIH